MSYAVSAGTSNTVALGSLTARSVWTGRTLSCLAILFLLFDAAMKLFRLPAAVDGTTQLGYPADVVVPLGISGPYDSPPESALSS